MVRAKSTRPAPVKKKAAAKPVRRATQRKAKKETAKRDAVMASVCHCGAYCFFIPCRFLLFLYPSLLLSLEALLWL